MASTATQALTWTPHDDETEDRATENRKVNAHSLAETLLIAPPLRSDVADRAHSRPSQKPRRFRFLLVLSCSERRQPAKKLIADRNDHSEEGADEFSVGFLMVGGQRGAFVFHPQLGKHPVMLSQVPMLDAPTGFFYEIRTLDARRKK